jgi:phosphoglycerate dehydrogenase-like enzyme
MTLRLAVPDADMLARLADLGDGVDASVWAPGSPPVDTPFDLLVLPYMIPASALDTLADQQATVIQAQMLGYDGIADHLPAGRVYCNAVDVHEAATGELAVALMLAAQRGIPDFVRAADAATWRHARHPGLALQRVLLLGAGGVGRQLAQRLLPFDVDLVRVARTHRADDLGEVEAWGDLPGLLPTADIVVLAVPLDDSTRGLVDAAFLDAMKHGALLVNVSRGPVVDTDALVRATASGRIRAALDVTDPEPLPDGHPLWTTPGVLVSPHVGGDVGSMSRRMDRLVREQVALLLAGEEPKNVVLRS